MTHSSSIIHETFILEIKNEFTLRLVNILKPHIYDGIDHVYEKSLDIHKKLIQLHELQTKNNKDTKINVPSKFCAFQNLLSLTKDWNQVQLEEETKRIRDSSSCGDILEKLLRAVIKSNIVLYTSGCLMKNERIAMKNLHNDIDLTHFIHLCYIYSAKRIYNEPHLFDDALGELDKHKNKIMTLHIVDDGIRDAIWHILPLCGILDEYLELDPTIQRKQEIIHINHLNEQLLRQQFNEKKNEVNTVNMISQEPKIPDMIIIGGSTGEQPQHAELELSNLGKPPLEENKYIPTDNNQKNDKISDEQTMLQVGGGLKSFHSTKVINNNEKHQERIKIPNTIQKQNVNNTPHTIKEHTERTQGNTRQIKFSSHKQSSQKHNSWSGNHDQSDDDDDDDNNDDDVQTGGNIQKAIITTFNKNGSTNLSEVDALEEYSNSIAYKYRKNK
jgi:hypothetical protein